LALSPNKDAIALLIDLPDCQRRERGRAACFAGRQIETGVVPGAADALGDHEPVGKRPVIVAAMRFDGNDIRAGAHEQNILIADMPNRV
jgi:hypothetical protein